MYIDNMASFTVCNSQTVSFIQTWTRQLSLLLDKYKWVIDSYVSDFYTENHWDKLPTSVKDYFDNVNPSHFAWLLMKRETPEHSRLIPPLILLSLHSCIQNLSLNRSGVDIESLETQQLVSSALLETSENIISKQNLSQHSAFVVTEDLPVPNYKNGQCLDMEHMFRKHVKPKKQHEINKLGRTIKILSETCKCSQVIDVGAGLGHLSRLLAFQHGLKAITVEAADGHAPKAASFDKETKKDIHRFHKKRKKESSAEVNLRESLRMHETDECLSIHSDLSDEKKIKIFSSDSFYIGFDSGDKSKVCSSDISGSSKNEISKNLSEEQFDYLPSHVVCEVHPDIEASHFLDLVQLKVEKEDSKFILVGLHACGDLTPTILRVFADCPNAMALASVACCYMKITSDGSRRANFPMSEFIKNLPYHELSYVSRELACHFIDAYYQRLKGNLPHLKIHSYRAALQCILKQIFPHFKNGDYRLVSKKGSQGTFTQYAVEILKKVGIDTNLVPEELFQHCELLTKYWKRVVAFYTLRLSLAPVVETFVLLDRALFLNEKGQPSVLIPIFDSSISPRNFALVAVKR